MRWQRGHRSSNVLDMRGRSGGGGFSGGGGGRGLLPLLLMLLRGRGGIAGIVVILVVLFLSRGNLGGLLGLSGGGSSQPATKHVATPQEEEIAEFLNFLVDDTQAVWTKKFAEMGKTYRESKLVLFTGSLPSGCGGATSAIGPHYCPADERMYIDLEFYEQLRTRFGAPGDFAQAYVLAHEVGHHVQHVLGTNAEVRRRQRANPAQKNELSVRLELQADCYAGVWAHDTGRRGLLERGDVEEGLGAAAAVGDDRIQKAATGRVSPESWTHGSSEQRMKWFLVGFDSGRVEDCNTLD